MRNVRTAKQRRICTFTPTPCILIGLHSHYDSLERCHVSSRSGSAAAEATPIPGGVFPSCHGEHPRSHRQESRCGEAETYERRCSRVAVRPSQSSGDPTDLRESGETSCTKSLPELMGGVLPRIGRRGGRRHVSCRSKATATEFDRVNKHNLLNKQTIDNHNSL